MSRSVGGELVRIVKRVLGCHAVDRKAPSVLNRVDQVFQDATTPLDRVRFYRVVVAASVAGSLLGAVACVVPKATGAICGAIGLILIVPLSVISFLLLRFDMFKLLVTTYDIWFYSFMNTLGAVLLAKSFGDARACVGAIFWLSNSHSVFVDANTRFISYLNVVSVAALVLNATLMMAMETKSIDAWKGHHFRLRVKHTDVVATDNLVSNGISTMAIVVLRNAYRRHMELVAQYKIGCPILRCLNYRCRVKHTAVNLQRVATIRSLTGEEKACFVPKCTATFPLVQMHFVRFPEVLDASDTFFPVQLRPLVWSPPKTVAFVILGCTGLGLTAASFGVYPSHHVQPFAIVGLCTTVLFMGFALSLYHRVATRAIVMTFDFAFLSVQLSLGFWSAAMLFQWDVRAIALASMWLWLHWVITIDGWTPLMHKKIGVNTKWLIVTVWVLFVAAQLCVAVEVFWRDRWKLSDRIVVSLFGRVKVHLVPFFLGRLIMTLLWSMRLLWRAATSDKGDAIVQIGRVGFKYTSKVTEPSRVITRVTDAANALLRRKHKAPPAPTNATARVIPVETCLDQ